MEITKNGTISDRCNAGQFMRKETNKMEK